MCLWSIVEKVSWLCSVQARDRGQPGEGIGSARHEVTSKHQAITTTHWENHIPELVHFTING
jgi:hypothetical protein